MNGKSIKNFCKNNKWYIGWSIVVVILIILAILIPLRFVDEDNMNIADIILTALYVTFTAILAVGAITAAIIAIKNLRQIRNQNKLNTFLALLRELGEPETRMNRNLVFHLHDKKSKDPKQYDQYREAIQNYDGIPWKYDASSGKPPELQNYKYAIEATVSCLDRLGFFLLEVDPNFKEESPVWVWTITSQMWERTNWYVMHRKQSHKYYGKYFEDLDQEAKNRGFSEQILNGDELENRRVT